MSDLKLRRQAVVELARGWGGPALRAQTPTRKRIAVDALVAWAYRRELPKASGVATGPAGFPVGWGKVSEWVEELSLAGLDDNRYGVAPDLTAQSEPHPDAVRVHEAMLRLEAEFAEVELPEGWSPLADLGLSGPHEARAIGQGLALATRVLPDGRRVMRRSPRQLVFRAAILGAPDWMIERPVERVVTEFGRPKWFLRETTTICAPAVSGGEVCETIEREVDGFDRKLRAPKPGAYQKTFLDPDPAEGVAGRAEWEIWIAALDALRSLLDGLEAHEATPCGLPARPWEGGGVYTGRILPDLRGRGARLRAFARDCSGVAIFRGVG